MKKAAPYRSRWKSAGIKIAACISHLQGKEIYVLARFTPFVEVRAGTPIKICHVLCAAGTCYFCKAPVNVEIKQANRFMDSLFKTIRLCGTAVNFFVPGAKAVTGTNRTCDTVS